MVYVNSGGFWFCQASSSNPGSASDFNKLLLVAPGLVPTDTNTRLISYEGAPLLLYRDAGQRSWLARAKNATPLAEGDWEHFLLDSHTSHADVMELDGIVVTAHLVDNSLRQQGYYITYPDLP
jgi:hypothetical protein